MKVALREVFARQDWEVFLYRERHGGKEFLQPDGTSILQADQASCSADIKPMLTLNQSTARELVEALMHAGVRPRDLTKIEGQYEAQSEHLRDLQNILRARGILKKDA